MITKITQSPASVEQADEDKHRQREQHLLEEATQTTKSLQLLNARIEEAFGTGITERDINGYYRRR